MIKKDLENITGCRPVDHCISQCHGCISGYQGAGDSVPMSRCCCWSPLSHLQYSHCSHHQPQPHSSSIPPPARIWMFLFTLLHQCCNSHILTIFPDLGNLKSQGALHSTISTLHTVFAGCRFQSGHKMFGCLVAGELGSWRGLPNCSQLS